MSDNDPGLFGHIPEQRTLAESRDLAHRRWEAAVVGRLLRFYGVERLATNLKRRCAAATGEHRLLFTWFADAFPDFPVWLGFRPVRYLHPWRMEDFLDRFSKSPAFDAFVEVEETAPAAWRDAGRPTALVFRYLHGYGAAVMTDCERPLGEDNTRIVKNFRRKNVYFEPLEPFLKGLGWEPRP